LKKAKFIKNEPFSKKKKILSTWIKSREAAGKNFEIF
jgi:hypothetical protein